MRLLDAVLAGLGSRRAAARLTHEVVNTPEARAKLAAEMAKRPPDPRPLLERLESLGLRRKKGGS